MKKRSKKYKCEKVQKEIKNKRKIEEEVKEKN